MREEGAPRADSLEECFPDNEQPKVKVGGNARQRVRALQMVQPTTVKPAMLTGDPGYDTVNNGSNCNRIEGPAERHQNGWSEDARQYGKATRPLVKMQNGVW